MPLRPGNPRPGATPARTQWVRLDGVDLLESGDARNAGLLAVRILAATDPALQQKMVDFQADLRDQAHAKGAVVRDAAAPRRTGF